MQRRMVLVIDAQIAGLSGDMFLCALVDMGADKNVILRGVKNSAKFLDGSDIEIMEFRQTCKNGISAFELNLTTYDNDSLHKSRKGTDMVDAIVNATTNLQLSNAATAYASRCIDILLDSESKVHGVSKDSVMFHEASDVDTLVDIVGTAIALDNLKLLNQRILCLPVCVGGGSVKFSHGIASNPANAILEIFKKYGIWMHGFDVDSELVTPTGACMLAAMQPEMINFYPHMQIDSIGYGAGQKNFDKFANVLKLVSGPEPYEPIKNRTVQRICMLETNIDDVSGEILGNMIDKMMNAGAKDVSISHGLTKKNRPTSLVSVMCAVELSEKLIDLLISETGTMGVRVSESQRVVMSRKQHCVNLTLFDKRFDIRYKKRVLDTVDDSCVEFKIEFDDLKMVSNMTNMPIRKIEPILRDMITKMNANNMSDNANVDICDNTCDHTHNNNNISHNKTKVDLK